jgi:hypothetical protein
MLLTIGCAVGRFVLGGGNRMSFIVDPKISLLYGGEYKLLDPVVYYSRELGMAFRIPASFVFSPSIPTLARIFVPVTSDIVAASLPHDFLYQTADRGVTRAQADIVGREELEHRGVSKHIVFRFYYALKVFGWIAWNKHRGK